MGVEINLNGRVALVTGAGPNIGGEIAATLARAGALVICNDLRVDLAQEAANKIVSEGGRAIAVPCDISNEDAVRAMYETAYSHFGLPVSILVNNAGISLPKGLLDTTYEEWLRVTGIILGGTYNNCREFARRLIEAELPGAIVNIGSTSGHRGRKNAIAYCTSKGGILNFTRALAVELAPFGIRVNSVSPTKTGGALAGGSAASRDFSEIPLQRLGRPEDQANAVLFAVSDLASFITGEDIRVDGGTLATWGTKSHPDSTSKAG